MPKEKEENKLPPEQKVEESAKKPATTPTKKAKEAPVVHPANWILLFILLLAVGYTGFATHQALTTPVVVNATPTPATSVLTGLPELTVHQNHQRQAPPIQVNQSTIGRPDPLLKP